MNNDNIVSKEALNNPYFNPYHYLFGFENKKTCNFLSDNRIIDFDNVRFLNGCFYFLLMNGEFVLVVSAEPQNRYFVFCRDAKQKKTGSENELFSKIIKSSKNIRNKDFVKFIKYYKQFTDFPSIETIENGFDFDYFDHYLFLKKCKRMRSSGFYLSNQNEKDRMTLVNYLLYRFYEIKKMVEILKYIYKEINDSLLSSGTNISFVIDFSIFDYLKTFKDDLLSHRIDLDKAFELIKRK
jgi:hypothetical protein